MGFKRHRRPKREPRHRQTGLQRKLYTFTDNLWLVSRSPLDSWLLDFHQLNGILGASSPVRPTRLASPARKRKLRHVLHSPATFIHITSFIIPVCKHRLWRNCVPGTLAFVLLTSLSFAVLHCVRLNLLNVRKGLQTRCCNVDQVDPEKHRKRPTVKVYVEICVYIADLCVCMSWQIIHATCGSAFADAPKRCAEMRWRPRNARSYTKVASDYTQVEYVLFGAPISQCYAAYGMDGVLGVCFTTQPVQHSLQCRKRVCDIFAMCVCMRGIYLVLMRTQTANACCDMRWTIASAWGLAILTSGLVNIFFMCCAFHFYDTLP